MLGCCFPRGLVCIDGAVEMEKSKEVRRGADGCGRV